MYDKDTEQFTIGKLADKAGVGIETVRFYERRALIKKPGVKEGFRKYSDEDAQRIRFIKRAQDLGFTLREIKGLLELNSNPQLNCSDVKKRTDIKIKEVEEKIRDLQRMKRSLKGLSEACDDSKEALSHCRILNCFDPGSDCK